MTLVESGFFVQNSRIGVNGSKGQNFRYESGRPLKAQPHLNDFIDVGDRCRNCVGDSFKMLVAVLTTNILNRLT